MDPVNSDREMAMSNHLRDCPAKPKDFHIKCEEESIISSPEPAEHKCPECGVTCQDQGALNAHMRSHLPKAIGVCRFCQAEFVGDAKRNL